MILIASYLQKIYWTSPSKSLLSPDPHTHLLLLAYILPVIQNNTLILIHFAICVYTTLSTHLLPHIVSPFYVLQKFVTPQGTVNVLLVIQISMYRRYRG